MPLKKELTDEVSSLDQQWLFSLKLYKATHRFHKYTAWVNNIFAFLASAIGSTGK